MIRSNLTVKYTIHCMSEFEKKFKESYNRENKEKFKGSVINEITFGVISSKKYPDVDDVITLIRLGNVNCTTEQAEGILERWLCEEANRERGLAGAFADCCRDMAIDLPINKNFVDSINSIENIINKNQQAQEVVNSLIEKIASISSKINKDDSEKIEDKLGDEDNIQ